MSVEKSLEENWFSWSDVDVIVDKTKSHLLTNCNGLVKPGELLALMGPSGSGKTTLLNTLAKRASPAKCKVNGDMKFNGTMVTLDLMKNVGAYVEQEDALVGSLTVKETIDYSAQLCGFNQKSFRVERVNELLNWFGLEEQANVLIGTPLTKGVSGGQKRRVSVASQLITRRKLLFLDEPTSGLDSKASYEVMSRVKQLAKAENMIVIASIHQPSTATFNLFDKVCFLSRGNMIYSGPLPQVHDYFREVGYPMPVRMNPAEFILDLINTDFSLHSNSNERLNELISKWKKSSLGQQLNQKIDSSNSVAGAASTKIIIYKNSSSELKQTFVLLKRLLVKSRRDILTYYVRFAMYFGLAILMGTVWLRLSTNQTNIQAFINAIFFSGAFMSFMAVAYIPSYLEDFRAFKRDRLNGLYGPTAFMISNLLIGIPFLFLLTLMFSIITYFMVHFRPSADGFFRYVMWLFLDLVAAESLVIFISTVAPIFVVALALTAFANGLWMSVGGFLVPSSTLNPFWYWTFYWVNYQRYVFQGMMFNEFQDRVYQCSDSCFCMYQSALQDQCQIAGQAVLESIGYKNNHTGEWVGLMIVLITIYRLLPWGYLILFKK